MSRVRLFKNGYSDELLGRQTVMLDGMQVGFVHDEPGSPVLCIRHIDTDTAQFLKDEVERLKGCESKPPVVPVPLPPEDEYDDEPEE